MFMQVKKSGAWRIVLVALAVVAAAAVCFFALYAPDRRPDEAPAAPKDGYLYEKEDVPGVGQQSPEGVGQLLPDLTAEPQIEDIQPQILPQQVQQPEQPAEPVAQVAGPVRIVSISTLGGSLSPGGEADYTSKPKIGKARYNDYLRRAAVAPEDGVQGDVTLTFYVNRYGRPSQIRVTEYLTQEAHREAIRLLENGPEWSATDRQVTVVMRFE